MVRSEIPASAMPCNNVPHVAILHCVASFDFDDMSFTVAHKILLCDRPLYKGWHKADMLWATLAE